MKATYFYFFCFFVTCFFFSSSNHLHSGVGTSGATILSQPIDARASGMAEAYTSVGGDVGGIASLHYNPAGPGFLTTQEVLFIGNRGHAEDIFTSVFWGIPTRIGTIASNLLYYSAGSLEMTDSNGDTRTLKAQEDMSTALSYSWSFEKKLAVGTQAKFIRSTLAESVTANAFAVDFGVQLKLLGEKVSTGFSIQNIGSRLKYIDVSDSLPLIIRLGVSFVKTFGEENQITCALDLIRQNDEKIKEFIGFEHLWNSMFALRIGYKVGQNLGKFNSGIGFSMGRYRIDYTVGAIGEIGLSHTASLRYQFGKLISTSHAKTKQIKSSDISFKRNEVVAVLNLQPQGVSEDAAIVISDLLQTAIVKKKIFAVVEKKQLELILKEQYLHLAVCTEVQCAIEVGKLLDANKVILGSLGKLGNLFVINIRGIDVVTGEVEYADKVEFNSLENIEAAINTLVNNISHATK